jgi:anthranilate/para-aminobenzoate synthase component II
MQVMMTASKQSQDGTALQFHPDSAVNFIFILMQCLDDKSVAVSH